MKRSHRTLDSRIRPGLVVLCLIAGLALAATPAAAITYNAGDVLYVAYKNNPSGAEYIVDLGPVTLFTTASTTFTLSDVSASDLNTIVGAASPNIFVGLFGILDTSTRDAIFAANGPKDDFSLLNSSLIGAVQQIDSFGQGLATFGSAVPSANPNAVGFPAAVTGSYQATLNASSQGSLGNNVAWSVETRLSSSTGVRISTPARIRAYASRNNPISGVQTRQQIGFFTLNGNGTITYSPDHDGDFIPDDLDLCPGISSANNTDADGDLHAVPCDCNDADPTAWAIPGAPIQNLDVDANIAVIWDAPSSLGGTSVQYDVFRGIASVPGTFPTTYACVQADTPLTSYTDPTTPVAKQAFIYFIRPQNSCGVGPIGPTLGGFTPAVPSCP
jgi:hypothetical protein